MHYKSKSDNIKPEKRQSLESEQNNAKNPVVVGRKVHTASVPAVASSSAGEAWAVAAAGAGAEAEADSMVQEVYLSFAYR